MESLLFSSAVDPDEDNGMFSECASLVLSSRSMHLTRSCIDLKSLRSVTFQDAAFYYIDNLTLESTLSLSLLLLLCVIMNRFTFLEDMLNQILFQYIRHSETLHSSVLK